MHTYTSKYRPVVGFGMRMPAPCELIERGTAGHYPLRKDLPEGATRHGVVKFDRALTVDEQSAIEFVPV